MKNVYCWVYACSFSLRLRRFFSMMSRQIDKINSRHIYIMSIFVYLLTKSDEFSTIANRRHSDAPSTCLRVYLSTVVGGAA